MYIYIYNRNYALAIAGASFPPGSREAPLIIAFGRSKHGQNHSSSQYDQWYYVKGKGKSVPSPPPPPTTTPLPPGIP